MAAGDDLLWDADDRSARWVPRLRGIGVTAAFLGVAGLLLWTDGHAGWALHAGALHLLGEAAHWVWDRRRLVEARVVGGGPGRPAGLRLRRVGGRTTEHDADRVLRVLVVHDNVHDLARLRLRLRGGRPLFGRPARPPALTPWRRACPKAHVGARAARWGMPGIPD
ncbi:hypothetical protein [Streptomyces griseoviridis]|uniref:DUF2061 domain-containing protein n=1 Tax=Streptomyces griseoviridis TaxID=45398 RepID=A0ABT9L7N9_STRGD|nr:hypothetical protein [Streptomyces griseoviridis]MDP9679722.1 hypothetical protein [Streptomyces griseoviridis]GGS99184.1 hypothetical protein GCM10010240_35530 [Streptomyces griseoviridis]